MSNEIEQTVSENQTAIIPFDPTPGMQIWVDAAVELKTDSPTKISQKCKMARQTWYDWLAIPGFEDWFYVEYKKRRRRWLPKLDAIGMKRAEKDYNYWKDMRKAAGEDVDSKTPVNPIQINFNATKYLK